jgi:hypothetical protein
VESREQRAESRERKAESGKQRAESRERRAVSGKWKAESEKLKDRNSGKRTDKSEQRKDQR